MHDEDGAVPVVSADSFRQAYEAAEDGVLKHPELALDLGETLRPTIRIARTIARGLTVEADELYALSVRVCALWRLLATDPAQLRPFGIGLGEEGIRGSAACRAALLETAASAPLSDDLRFEADSFLSALRRKIG